MDNRTTYNQTKWTNNLKIMGEKKLNRKRLINAKSCNFSVIASVARQPERSVALQIKSVCFIENTFSYPTAKQKGICLLPFGLGVKYCILFLFFFFALTNTQQINAQSAKKMASQINTHLESVRNNAELTDISPIIQTPKGQEAVLGALTPFYADSVYKVRLEAYKICYRVGIKGEVLETRQTAVEALTKGLFDANLSIANWSARHLSVFNRSDFTTNSKGNITKTINDKHTKLSELIKMAGYLNIIEAKPTIQNAASFSKNTSDRWAAYLALARMGESGYMSRATNMVRKQDLNDDVVYELIPGLIYTRQKECIDFAIEILYNDKKKCSSPNPDSGKKMQCGYRILEYLAPVIKDFPYKVKTSGDLDTDDYSEALTKTREWFLQKGSSYEIIDETY